MRAVVDVAVMFIALSALVRAARWRETSPVREAKRIARRASTRGDR